MTQDNPKEQPKLSAIDEMIMQLLSYSGTDIRVTIDVLLKEGETTFNLHAVKKLQAGEEDDDDEGDVPVELFKKPKVTLPQMKIRNPLAG